MEIIVNVNSFFLSKDECSLLGKILKARIKIGLEPSLGDSFHFNNKLISINGIVCGLGGKEKESYDYCGYSNIEFYPYSLYTISITKEF